MFYAACTMRPSTDQPTDQSALIRALRHQIAYLRDQLAQERAANRENRRIIAAYQGRMPELEAPSEPREAPEATTEDDGRGEGRGGEGGPSSRRPSWWQSVFG